MVKTYGDQRFIGASLGSATGGVPQNDRAFASTSIATQSAEYTTCAKTSPLKNPLPQVASRSANGLLAAISPADLPAVFSFCTRSRATTSMSRNLVRSALLPSGPCPGTILVLLMLHDPMQKALFPHLPEEVVADLPNHGEVLDFPDGAVLFSEGERDYPFYAILSGRVKVTKRFATEQQTLTIHGPGQFAGEIRRLTCAPALAT